MSRLKVSSFRCLPRAALALVLLASAHVQVGAIEVAKAPSASAPVRNIVEAEKNLYSRDKEELIIRDFFQDRRGGVFLDVGAWHPIQASNTYYLEHHLGWTGVAIDALKEMAPRWKRNRPRSRFLNYIVTDQAGALKPFFRVEFTDVSAVTKPKLGPGGKAVASTAVMVPTITLTKALDDQGVKKIDLLSMDIEGSEIPALAGFDIERFHPELVCVESKPKNRGALLAYFKGHGYRQIEKYLKYDTANWYFTPLGVRP